MVCGGLERSSADASDLCHKLGNPEEPIVMRRKVHWTASVVVFEGSTLWVTGGFEVSSTYWGYSLLENDFFSMLCDCKCIFCPY